MNTLLLVGRIIFGGYSIHNGVSHFIGFGMMAQCFALSEIMKVHDTLGNSTNEEALKVILTN